MKRFEVDFKGIVAADGKVISDENAAILGFFVEECIHYYRLGRRNTYIKYGVCIAGGVAVVTGAVLTARYLYKRRKQSNDK